MLVGCITLFCNDLFIWGKQVCTTGFCPACLTAWRVGSAGTSWICLQREEPDWADELPWKAGQAGWGALILVKLSLRQSLTEPGALQGWLQSLSLPPWGGGCSYPHFRGEEMRFREVMWLAWGLLAKQWRDFPIWWVSLHFAHLHLKLGAYWMCMYCLPLRYLPAGIYFPILQASLGWGGEAQRGEGTDTLPLQKSHAWDFNVGQHSSILVFIYSFTHISIPHFPHLSLSLFNWG